MPLAEYRPKRVTNIVDKEGFPPNLRRSIVRTNEKLESQLAGYMSLFQRLLALQHPEGYEPRYSSFSGLITEFKYPQLEILFNLRAWTGMPPRLKEIFIWDSFVETKPIKGTFQLELPQRPDCPTSLAPQAVVNSVFSQLGFSPLPQSEGGLNFRIGYVNRAPLLPGYVQEIGWATRRDRYDPIRALLDNPQYSSLKQELFEELQEWLEMCLREGNIT